MEVECVYYQIRYIPLYCGAEIDCGAERSGAQPPTTVGLGVAETTQPSLRRHQHHDQRYHDFDNTTSPAPLTISFLCIQRI